MQYGYSPLGKKMPHALFNMRLLLIQLFFRFQINGGDDTLRFPPAYFVAGESDYKPENPPDGVGIIDIFFTPIMSYQVSKWYSGKPERDKG